MNIPPRFLPRSLPLVAGCVFVAVFHFGFPACAFGAELPTISFDVKKNDEKVVQPPKPAAAGASGSAGRGATAGGTGRGLAGSKSLGSSTTDVTYLISLRNTSMVPALNLEVEYHFYTKTATTTNGETTYDIEDVNSIENVDLDVHKAKDIVTQPIALVDNQSTASSKSLSSGAAARGKGKSSVISSSVITSLLGWHVEIRFNDKIIAHKDSPDNLQDLLKQYH